MKIVSLVPSATDTLLALGVTPVAVTRFCEHPELPAVGGTKDPDVTRIVALEPDVVVLCEEENRREDAAALVAAGVAIATLVVESVDDAVGAVRLLAAVAGADLADVPPVVPAPPVATVRARAFVPVWRRPYMSLAGDTYGSAVLAHLGVANVFADAQDRYPEVTLEDAADRSPDVVLAPSEPYPFGERHVGELSQVAPVVLVDGKDLFWWGARTPSALERLGAQLDDVLAR